jgi:two-component system, cell cycle sensor histidine kinase and response regulator CckA
MKSGERPGPTTVLVTEDDHDAREFAADTLRLGGYEVLEAENPSEALALSRDRARGIALLITDLVMPELNGLQLAELLRSSQPSVKVLFMSGYGEASIAAEGRQGARGRLLHKPFGPDDLLRRVREVLGEADPR